MMIVFGSVAKGKEQQGSDIDIAYSAPNPLKLTSELVLRKELFKIFLREADLVYIPHASVLLMTQISKYGTLIFGSQSDFNSFKLNSFHRKNDYAPYFLMQERLNKRFLSHAG